MQTLKGLLKLIAIWLVVTVLIGACVHHTANAHNVPQDSMKSGVVQITMLNGGRCSATHLGNNVYITAAHCMNLANEGEGSYFVKVNDQTSVMHIHHVSFTTGSDGFIVFSTPWIKNLYPAVQLAHRVTKKGYIRCFPIMRIGSVTKPQYFTKEVENMSLNNNKAIVNVNAVVSGGCSGGALFNEDGELLGVTLHSYYHADVSGFANTMFEGKVLREVIKNANTKKAKNLDGEEIRRLLPKDYGKKAKPRIRNPIGPKE